MKKWFPLWMLLLLAALTGCSSEKTTQPPTAVCYAIANTANSQGLNLNSDIVRSSACTAIENYGFVSVVNIDGSPEVLMADSYDIPEKYKQASAEKLRSDAQANTAALLAGLQTVVADDPEVDYLEGLQLAVRSLSGLEGYASKTIIVLGTGLSSSGSLDFRNNLLSAEPEAVIELLAERQEIPDFTGITVVWQQLGDVAAPQEAMTRAQRQRLLQLWSGIVERGNGSFVYDETIPLSAAPAAGYPNVSVVELTEETPIRFEPEAPVPEAQPLLQSPLVLTEEQVAFIGDEANYLEPDAAARVLKPIAQYLLDNPGISVLLAGTTAGDSTNAYTRNLSSARASTVRSTLIAFGVPEARITAVGLGSSDPWHISGVGTDGPLAAANRKVVILDASSETARLILGSNM